ncbi:unnamed protein product [Diabrotica balteata]|uniref:Uncharacterized protein n=1 Tax=Diabrotica balteata TaxID=107213 RepID=A0A9N9SQ95_DIABA|nr:unnamed protein product [Diabrotica balteata]
MNNIIIEPSSAGKGRKPLVNKDQWKREIAKKRSSDEVIDSDDDQSDFSNIQNTLFTIMLETPENAAIKNDNKKPRKPAINSRAQVFTKDLFGRCIGKSDLENIKANTHTTDVYTKLDCSVLYEPYGASELVCNIPNELHTRSHTAYSMKTELLLGPRQG